jgi:hypothetical protein
MSFRPAAGFSMQHIYPSLYAAISRNVFRTFFVAFLLRQLIFVFSSITLLDLFDFHFSSEIALSVAYSSAKQFWPFRSSSSIACGQKNLCWIYL